MKFIRQIVILSLLVLGQALEVFGQDVSSDKWNLQQCLDYAVANNINVGKSKYNVENNQLSTSQSKNNKLPSLFGTVSGSSVYGQTIDPITSEFVNQNVFSNSMGLSMEMILYQGNELNLQIQKSKILEDQSQLYLEESQNSIQLSVIEAYLRALYNYEGIEVAIKNLESFQFQVEQSAKRFESGAISKKELMDLETQAANSNYLVVSAQSQYDQQVLALKQLLELDPMVDFEIEIISLDATARTIPDKYEVFSNATYFLPDLKIWEKEGEAIQTDIKIAKSNYLPSLSLGGRLSTGYTNTLSSDYVDQINGNFSRQISVNLSVPIFSKKQNKTNVAQARIRLQSNELDKIGAEKNLFSKIETAWQNATANKAQLQSAEIARDNALVSFELAEKQYDLGGLTATELAVSRNQYLTAEESYLQSKYLLLLYSYLLDFYHGQPLNI
tara:strand:+ start:1104 stop:2435 length:1332 start_codon:yes stop_codon:yes gene_type:complete